MYIHDSAINISYPRVENIKKRFILNEELFKADFNEANIIPIPEEAPIEIPRIHVQSRQEHSHLNIAPAALTLQTIYSDDFCSDWKKCQQYLIDKTKTIFSLTDKLTDENYNYIGVVINLIWDEVDKNGCNTLFENLFGKTATENLSDLLVKYTYVEENQYYINVTLQNERVYERANLAESGSFTDELLKGHTIKVTLDINDRYGFNNQKGYKSQKEYFDKIMCIADEVIKNKLCYLIEKGVY